MTTFLATKNTFLPTASRGARRWLALSALALTFTLAPTDADALSPKKRAKLESGEVVSWTRMIKGRPVPQGNAMALVDADIKTVWSLLEDCSQYSKTMDRVKHSKLTRKWKAGGKEHFLCEVEIGLPFPLSNLTVRSESVHTVKPGTYYERAWKLDPSKGPDDNDDLKYSEGFWKLEPYDHGGRIKTLVRYRTHSEPNSSVPTWVLKKAQRSALPNVVANLRTHAEKRAKRAKRAP